MDIPGALGMTNVQTANKSPWDKETYHLHSNNGWNLEPQTPEHEIQTLEIHQYAGFQPLFARKSATLSSPLMGVYTVSKPPTLGLMNIPCRPTSTVGQRCAPSSERKQLKLTFSAVKLGERSGKQKVIKNNEIIQLLTNMFNKHWYDYDILWYYDTNISMFELFRYIM